MMGPRHETTTVSTTDGLVSVLILLGPRLRSRPFPRRAIIVKAWALLSVCVLDRLEAAFPD
jgi:hypothetical protein